MKDRAVDLALIVGLVLVAGAIVWTLFSLGGSSRPAPPDAGPGVNGAAVPGGAGGGDPDGGGSGGGVVPVAPGGDADSAADGSTADGSTPDDASAPDAGGATPLPPGDVASDGVDANRGDADDASPSPASDAATADRPTPEIPAAEAPPVPESGPAELGRIGFSYVTGGAGACGIVLEAWTHVAVSRELLAAYGCGAEVTVTLDDPTDGRTRLPAIVADTMNEAFSRTVNVYVGEDEPALAYGLTSGTIAPR